MTREDSEPTRVGIDEAAAARSAVDAALASSGAGAGAGAGAAESAGLQQMSVQTTARVWVHNAAQLVIVGGTNKGKRGTEAMNEVRPCARCAASATCVARASAGQPAAAFWPHSQCGLPADAGVCAVVRHTHT